MRAVAYATGGILCTCPAFGPAIEAVQAELSIPVLNPNVAAFSAALDRGGRIGLLVTFAPSLEPLNTELRGMAAARGKPCELRGVLVKGALQPLQAGKPIDHDAAIAAAAAGLADCDVILVGQFSMARARVGMCPALQARVLTTPESAVTQLRRHFDATGNA